MSPTLNGVRVWLEEYGCWIITDRYDLDGMLVLRTTAAKINDLRAVTPNDTALRVHWITHWFDEHQNYGVMLVQAGDWAPFATKENDQ